MSLSQIKVNDTIVASVDNEPTVGSENLIRSGSVYDLENDVIELKEELGVNEETIIVDIPIYSSLNGFIFNGHISSYTNQIINIYQVEAGKNYTVSGNYYTSATERYWGAGFSQNLPEIDSTLEVMIQGNQEWYGNYGPIPFTPETDGYIACYVRNNESFSSVKYISSKDVWSYKEILDELPDELQQLEESTEYNTNNIEKLKDELGITRENLLYDSTIFSTYIAHNVIISYPNHDNSLINIYQVKSGDVINIY